MMRGLQDPLARFLRELEDKSGWDRRDAFINAAMETDGTYQVRLQPKPTIWTVTVHGITGTGPDEDSAVAHWIDRAQVALTERA